MNISIKHLLFHGIDFDLKNIVFYKESTKNIPKNEEKDFNFAKQRTRVGFPFVRFQSQ